MSGMSRRAAATLLLLAVAFACDRSRTPPTAGAPNFGSTVSDVGRYIVVLRRAGREPSGAAARRQQVLSRRLDLGEAAGASPPPFVGTAAPLFPARDVGVLVGAAGLSVAAEGGEVVAGRAVLARALVEVRPAPRVERHRLLQVGAPPVAGDRLAHGLLLERREALLGGGIAAVVEPVVVERQPEQLDLRPGGSALRFGNAAQDAGPDQRGEQPQHDDHDEDLDQREAAGCVRLGPRHAL